METPGKSSTPGTLLGPTVGWEPTSEYEGRERGRREVRWTAGREHDPGTQAPAPSSVAHLPLSSLSLTTLSHIEEPPFLASWLLSVPVMGDRTMVKCIGFKVQNLAFESPAGLSRFWSHGFGQGGQPV